MKDQTTKSEFRRKLLMIVVSTGVALATLGVGGELAVRYRERTRESQPGTMPLLFYRHARLGHALVHDYDYFGWFHTNDSGFRGTQPVQVSKTTGTFRILALGGSTTFDSQVSPDSSAWPARTESWLDQLSAGTTTFEVINGGTPGYRVVDNSIRLMTDLYRYCPDLIVLYHTHNDLIRALRPESDEGRGSDDRPDEVKPVTPWKRWLQQHSLFYVKLKARMASLRRGSENRQRLAQVRQDEWLTRLRRGATDFERDVRFFLGIATGLGVPVLLPQVAHMSGAGTLAEPDSAIAAEVSSYFGTPLPVVLTGYEWYSERLRGVADEFTRDGMALATYLPTKSFGLRGSQWFAPEDPIHFNRSGADRMGHHMAEAILGLGLPARTECAATITPWSD